MNENKKYFLKALLIFLLNINFLAIFRPAFLFSPLKYSHNYVMLPEDTLKKIKEHSEKIIYRGTLSEQDKKGSNILKTEYKNKRNKNYKITQISVIISSIIIGIISILVLVYSRINIFINDLTPLGWIGFFLPTIFILGLSLAAEYYIKKIIFNDELSIIERRDHILSHVLQSSNILSDAERNYKNKKLKI